ncbi:hypothetical protein MPH_09746 [Macrophomina phaseolina MS6]|uniref:Uncharacterized protein n=1 Tax=Macrophomina phaseolina (strain MS6) TaxID=1126212 RepID=K2QTU1_MACPH|nr:hypothetical protein MPH_09746 [Macrophomina phaseolina MS6]
MRLAPFGRVLGGPSIRDTCRRGTRAGSRVTRATLRWVIRGLKRAIWVGRIRRVIFVVLIFIYSVIAEVGKRGRSRTSRSRTSSSLDSCATALRHQCEIGRRRIRSHRSGRHATRPSSPCAAAKRHGGSAAPLPRQIIWETDVLLPI